MSGKGVEPSRILLHTNLNRARLPIPPPGHLCISIISPSFFYASSIISQSCSALCRCSFATALNESPQFAARLCLFAKLLRSLPLLYLIFLKNSSLKTWEYLAFSLTESKILSSPFLSVVTATIPPTSPIGSLETFALNLTYGTFFP